MKSQPETAGYFKKKERKEKRDMSKSYVPVRTKQNKKN